MSDAADVNLPPPPKVDGRSKEARARRARAERVQDDKIETQEAEHVRPTRSETTRRERRRRENVDQTGNMRLGFRFKPDPTKVYRWTNEGIDGQRLKDRTIDDDWDLVSATGEQTSDIGTAMRRAVGESKSGPIYSYLLQKDRDWHEADYRKMQERDDQMMTHIKEGRPPTAPGRGLTEQDHAYGDGVRMSSGLSKG